MTNDLDSDSDTNREADLRPSPIAGLWYSNSPKRLSQEIDEYMNQANLPALQGEVVGVIAPHAGYRYSGPTAGYAFRSVKGQEYDLVVVASPLHAYHPAPFLTSSHDAYSTPLGNVRIDTQAINDLERYLDEQTGEQITRIRNDGEHSLEIELPFLQRALEGEFTLLPLMVRSQNSQAIEHLGKGLAKISHDRSILLVASSDLSHFYPEAVANRLDSEMLRQISAFSPEGVLKAEHEGTGFACGSGAVAAILWAALALGANAVDVLHHSTSADETHDISSVVGYGAAVILKHP
jgi:AmmeMemoRadiSam system protein B